MRVPDVMPQLRRGKHRNQRRGACFMELASFLAGERWSDHPACTHPLLATTARLVNDNVDDEHRQRLAPLVPSVIGLTGSSPRWDVTIARRAAATALPVAAEARQRALAVGLLTCERAFDELDGRPAGTVDPVSHGALSAVPLAYRWAERYSAGQRVSLNAFCRHAARAIVLASVAGVAEACIRDPSALLVDLLGAVVADCEQLRVSTAVPSSVEELVAG